MQAAKLVFALTLLISMLGCLNFGDDEETSTPSAQQVARSRAEMYLNPSLSLVPLGYKLQGSGIDDSIWFKFETDASSPEEIFDTAVVDVSEFAEGFVFDYGSLNDVTWWDVDGKNLFGGHVELPHVTFMNVGMQKTTDGYIVYIMWHEI